MRRQLRGVFAIAGSVLPIAHTSFPFVKGGSVSPPPLLCEALWKDDERTPFGMDLAALKSFQCVNNEKRISLPVERLVGAPLPSLEKNVEKEHIHRRLTVIESRLGWHPCRGMRVVVVFVVGFDYE